MSNISAWSTTAGSNNAAAPNGAPEGMAPSGVNDVIRENMAATAKFYKDTQGTLVTTGTANAYVLTTNNAHATLAAQSLITFRANFTNSGAATLNVDGLGAKSIRAKGSTLTSNEIISGATYVAAYNASADAYDLVGFGALPSGFINQQVFASSGTWTKPSAGTIAMIEVWSGGGGGARNTGVLAAGGGSGGEYVVTWALLSGMGATETVTIGAGGTGRTASAGAGTAGGDTTVGALITAVGGNPGVTTSSIQATIPRTASATNNRTGLDLGVFVFAQAGTGGSGEDSTAGTAGRNTIYGGGGGGGAGSSATAGGVSEIGGNGGASKADGTNAVNGSAPSGGGGGASADGNGGNGGAGYARITVW